MRLVSAILPTRGRPQYARQALQCFLSQTYTHRELIIFDDVQDPSFPEDPHMDGVFYAQHPYPLTIAEKRNCCCEMARGDIVVHFDSDDWSASDRIADQLQRIKDTDKAVTGYHSMYFYGEEDGQAYWYKRAIDGYVLGTSLCFLKGFWKDHPFHQTKQMNEDNYFCGQAKKWDQLSTAEAGSLMVARIHSGNTSIKNPRVPGGTSYIPVSLDSLPKGFFAQ
jgi:glycosyltransferase involved in cell wall biosynthesis